MGQISANRYFGSTLYVLAYMYEVQAVDEEERSALSDAYDIVADFQKDRWDEESPNSIADVDVG